MATNDSTYTDAIVQIVSEISSCTDQPVTGAILAEQLRIRFPDKSYIDFGYQKLAEPVNELVQSGQLARNSRVKHLEVAPPSWSFDESRSLENSKPTGRSYIREDAWLAFAMHHERAVAIYDRKESKFRVLNCDAKPEKDQIVVETLSNDTHLSWVECFVTEKKLTTQPEMLQSKSVLRDFSVWMQNQPSNIQHDWKEYRAGKVATAIRDWCNSNGVESDEFLTQVIPSFSRRTTLNSGDRTEVDARAAILKCVADLSSDDLLDIKLPLRVVLKYFKPRG